jgi:predicted lipoprotein with Yx(FWY)xxD motif
LAATIGAVIALVAAGGGNDTSVMFAGSPVASGAIVAARSSTLGKILVDDQGRTLSLFEKDTRPRHPALGPALSLGRHF